MFELTLSEFENLRCQIGTSRWDSIRYAPMAFTEHGVVMLASIMNSERAINVNIRIIRIYNRLRAILKDNKLFWDKLEKMQSILVTHENSILAILEYIKKLEEEKEELIQQKSRKRIGYK
jgi:N-glycosylase/DNA lyase